MSESDLPGLTQKVLWAAFGLGLMFGAVAQRSQFCTMGALADLVSMGDTTRLRMWALAAGVAVLGFNAMLALGWVQVAHSIHAGPVMLWLSLVVGGLMFGMGMVLASGCGSKTLVRLGGGSLKALVVLLVMGLSAWATLRGVLALLRTGTVDRVSITWPVGQDLPSLAQHLVGGTAGTGGSAWALGMAAVLGLALVVFGLALPAERRREVLLGGLGIGALVVAGWWVSGVLGHLPEHPQTLEPAFIASGSRRMESLTFVAPLAYGLEYLVFASDASRTITQGTVVAVGVVLGSAAVALATGQFRWEGFTRIDDLARHLAGGALMGAGGVTALGCSIGQGLTGLSTLSLGSMLAVLAIGAGAWLALRWQLWQLERQC